MNIYLIEHKVKTLTELWDAVDSQKDFEFRDFKFRQWNFTISDGALGNAWIARKEVQASSAVEALNIFRKELFDIVRRVSFVSQCFSTADLEPYFILRLNDNSTKSFFFSFSQETNHVPLHFGDEEKESLKKLESFDRSTALEYISQSTRSTTYTTRLAMLIIALESIAGETSPGVTNKEYIKREILNDDSLYDELFQRETGVRNKIFHGKEVEYGKDYSQIIYEKIVDYFNKKYQTKVSKEVIHPQRTPFGNYTGYTTWLKPPMDYSDWDLRTILEISENDWKGRDLSKGVSFDIVPRPDHY